MLAFALHSATYTNGKKNLSLVIYTSRHGHVYILWTPLIGFIKSKAGCVGSERLVWTFHAPLWLLMISNLIPPSTCLPRPLSSKSSSSTSYLIFSPPSVSPPPPPPVLPLLPPSPGIFHSMSGLQISVTVSLWNLLHEKWRPSSKLCEPLQS